ncbi:MAG: DUF3096 domain-containing protein, partial [Candidatus Peribacteraceae bacterium]
SLLPTPYSRYTLCMFHFSLGQHRPQFGSGMRTGLLFNGILCVLFGFAILVAPELLAYIVATFLIIVGISLIAAWWKVHNALRGKW